ncbi:Ig-like domain-containing protein, partial [Salmonella enterica]|uniref:Ig-like domain-containing protein n=1 Tax=Salmonella enterica TaxID=28901 RepID=UPI0021B457CE
ACTTNGSGECTSTVKTTKAGTYNVWVALVPDGAAQPVSPVKTALVFLAGPPDATNTTVSTDRSAANADNKETITVTLTPRDSHNNVVPLWTFRKDLTIVPSVNATVPGAVTVTTPAQDAAGAVTATLTYVDTSGQLLSKAARSGSTTVNIGSAVKRSVDTRFYPQVHVCLTNLDSNGYVTPGTTEVHICDGSGHAVPNSSGYTVTAPGISSSGCPTDGGGVCPSDAAGKKATFENLTGDDILTLARGGVKFRVHDVYAVQDMISSFTTGAIAFYGELKTHWPATNLGATKDLFHTTEAHQYCSDHTSGYTPAGATPRSGNAAATAILAGASTGGAPANDSTMATIRMGGIANAVHTGGDTNPEIFVDGISRADFPSPHAGYTEVYRQVSSTTEFTGTFIPSALVFVNGGRNAATSWTAFRDGATVDSHPSIYIERSIGKILHDKTGWNLSDAYFVNNWPGTPYTTHKGNGDDAYHYVTQVNYITGYICAASLQ